jgi:hypothetical protein
LKERDGLVISKGVVIGALIVSFLPIFRAGLRDNISFWEFVRQHTIWGDPVEYIPEEEYGLPERVQNNDYELPQAPAG